ncbi:hypothetical protein [Mycobacterium branderi]|nr:hypothetical protein [Mycobacterium branderi]
MTDDFARHRPGRVNGHEQVGGVPVSFRLKARRVVVAVLARDS